MTNNMAHIIRQLRLDKNLSQKDLASMSGVCRHTVAKIESPNYYDVRLLSLVKVSCALGFDLDVTLEKRK